MGEGVVLEKVIEGVCTGVSNELTKGECKKSICTVCWSSHRLKVAQRLRKSALRLCSPFLWVTVKSYSINRMTRFSRLDGMCLVRMALTTLLSVTSSKFTHLRYG